MNFNLTQLTEEHQKQIRTIEKQYNIILLGLTGEEYDFTLDALREYHWNTK
ncbi:hypothetical protein ACE38V_01365 [Cytobacillus sp. Hz8]|uniref:hypothetical protein n=1 Tax=Cytobacillus sp. Hz8 TaxID=3347168 RepID=UPI0035DFD6E2